MGLSDPNDNLRVITNSTFKRWMACRRQFYYRYIGGFRKEFSNLAAQAGTLIHALLEEESKHNARIQKAGLREQEGERRKSNPYGYAERRLRVLSGICRDWENEAMQPFFQNPETSSPPGYTEATVVETLDTCKQVFRNWLVYRGHIDLMKYEVVHTEFKFELPLLSPQGKRLRGWLVSGLVDCLLYDRARGIYVLREYKTTSSDPSDFQGRVALDPQVRIYADACVRSGLTNGEPIRSVEYAVLRRKIPSLPKKVKCKSCKGKGEKKEDVVCFDCQGTKIFHDPELGKEQSCTPCKGKGMVKGLVECPNCKEGLVWSTANLDTTFDTLVNYFKSIDEDFQNPQVAELLEKHKHKDWSKFCSIIEHSLQDSDTSETLGELYRASREINSAVNEYRETSDMTVFPKNTQHCQGSYFGCSYKDICGLRTKAGDVDLARNYFVECSDHPELDDR